MSLILLLTYNTVDIYAGPTPENFIKQEEEHNMEYVWIVKRSTAQIMERNRNQVMFKCGDSIF